MKDISEDGTKDYAIFTKIRNKTDRYIAELHKEKIWQKGDCNLDGNINGADIDAFIDVLNGKLNGEGNRFAADCNYDGLPNFSDIDPFYNILQGRGIPQKKTVGRPNPIKDSSPPI